MEQEARHFLPEIGPVILRGQSSQREFTMFQRRLTNLEFFVLFPMFVVGAFLATLLPVETYLECVDGQCTRHEVSLMGEPHSSPSIDLRRYGRIGSSEVRAGSSRGSHKTLYSVVVARPGGQNPYVVTHNRERHIATQIENQLEAIHRNPHGTVRVALSGPRRSNRPFAAMALLGFLAIGVFYWRWLR